MNVKEFSRTMEIRTKNFAIDAIRLSSNLPVTLETNVIRYQLTKSASSVGANYREANRSKSKADFHNKIRICVSEASETHFWLEIIDEFKWIPEQQINEIQKECSELIAIFSAINKHNKG